MSTSQPITQSVEERRSAESELSSLIAKFAPKHARLIAAARRSLRKRLPAAHEMVYEYRTWFVLSYSPSGRGFEGILALRADADGVKLYFNQGKGLPDPEKLLQGSASQVRFIDLEGVSTLARPAVMRLIDEALSRNRVPFASTGRGPTIIMKSRRADRSAAAKSKTRPGELKPRRFEPKARRGAKVRRRRPA